MREPTRLFPRPRLLAPVCPHATPDGYEFHPQWNSFDNDLNEEVADRGDWLGKVPELTKACNSDNRCAGAQTGILDVGWDGQLHTMQASQWPPHAPSYEGFNTGGYTKRYVLKNTRIWRRLPANMVWPGGATGYPACEGIYIRQDRQCGSSGQYCASEACCSNVRCCLEGTTCCGTHCCTAGEQCCDGGYCAASCTTIVEPSQGTSPTTRDDWVEEAQKSGEERLTFLQCFAAAGCVNFFC